MNEITEVGDPLNELVAKDREVRAWRQVGELQAELDRLRKENAEYRKSMREHAEDPDQPCEACQEVLLSY